MITFEMVVFWSVVILLLAFTLTTGRERWNFVKGIYTHCVKALKNHRYMNMLVSGDFRKGKKRIGVDNITTDVSHKPSHQKNTPNPRNSL